MREAEVGEWKKRALEYIMNCSAQLKVTVSAFTSFMSSFLYGSGSGSGFGTPFGLNAGFAVCNQSSDEVGTGKVVGYHWQKTP